MRLRGEIRALQQQLGVTTIMVTHDQEEALSMADRIVVMNHGVIEQVGTPLEIYREPATPFVADFVGKINVLPARAASGRRPAHRQPAASPASATPTAERDVKVYLRPEDVLARPIAAGDANVFDARDREDRVPRLVLPRARQRRRRSARSRSPCTCRSTSSPSRASQVGSRCRCKLLPERMRFF